MTGKEIVQALRCCAEDECKDCQLYGKIAWVETLCKYALDLNEHLTAENAALREKKRWIPVAERMPEVWRNDETAELVNYMIYRPDFGVDIGNYHAKAKMWICMALPCTVTHWMPLPEAPKFADVLRGAPEAQEGGEKA